MCENEPNVTFLTLAMTFRMIQSNPSLHSLVSPSWGSFNQIQLWVVDNSTIPGKVHAKIEKRLPTSFWENDLKCKKGTILTFWPLKKNLYSDSTKSFLGYVVNVIPKKLHAKIEKKLLKRFSPLKLTPTKTDESAFEKLRCQVAQRR